MSSDYERIRRDNIREYGEGTRHLDFLQRLYAERTHFIFELLQNAEDAHASQVTFVLDQQRLLVRHDGRLFNENDVRGICGVSASTKDDDLTDIGKFGIGFKSVYAYTTLPEVHSGEEHFRIRHYVRPEPAARPREPLNGQTLFVFPFDREDVPLDQAQAEITGGLRDLDPVTLLFLRHIHSVTLESADGTIHLTRTPSEADPNGVELIRRVNGRVVLHQYWWTFRRSLDHLGHAGQRVEIAFKRAGSDPHAPVEPLRSSPLIAYFPTDKQTRLGFLLQAPLRTTPARDNVPEHDPDNIALIGEATHLLVDTLERLRDTGRLGLDVFEALPLDTDAFPDGAMLRRVFDGVRDALRARPLLPTTEDTGHVSAAEMRLARGAGIRELLTPAQLGLLTGAPRPVHWQPPQLTRERNRMLWDYLRQEVGVEEITPEWIVGHLDTGFLHGVDDSWLIQFYRFLVHSPALWRASRSTIERPGPARTLPLIRLEDATHVAPFDAAGRPNAYLPGSTPSDYPTVRRRIAADPDARSFLTVLGLQEPDAVDEVLEKVLPRYQEASTVVDDDQHGRDLALIGRALQVASRQRRTTLLTPLSAAPFLHARTADYSVVGYRAPTECYWPNDELEHYFRPCLDAWFLDARYEAHRAALTELGVADQVRVHASRANASGHVVLRDAWGEHRRGLNGFDPDLRSAGLDAALNNPDHRRSAYVWNLLLAPRADRLRGTVESAGRAQYINSTRHDHDTEPHRLATDRAWLPKPSGGWARPRELALDDLPPDFLPLHGLADSLGMITSVIQQASTQLGISVDLLRYLADNPDALADLTREARRATTTPAETTDHHTAALDFTTKLQNAFTKPADGAHQGDDDDSLRGAGQVADPAMRRERIAAAITDTRAVEPPPKDRFRFLPRKVWDGKNTSIRQFLLEQYAGRCQICAATFPKRDGDPYFEVVYLVSHTNAAWIDRPGDVLCLCPTCTAKFLHGEVQATDVLDQVRSWRARTEGGDRAVLQMTLCGHLQTINYTEKHLLDLQTLVTQA